MTKSPPSLLEKISGPQAVPIILLIEKGEAAAARVNQGFADFLGQRIQDLFAMRERIIGPGHPGLREFYAAVVDLRGSAATAGRPMVVKVAASMEALLKEKQFDARAASVLASHLDALMLLSGGGQSDEAIRLLTVELQQAVKRLDPRQEPLPVGA